MFKEYHISSKRKVFDLGLYELWAYRSLIWLFVKRDFSVNFKQTILGPAWHIISPLLSTLLYYFVFTRVAKLPNNNTPPFLFYLSGLILWNYISSTTGRISDTFIANAHIYSKVYFARLAVPISTALSNLIPFSIQLLLFSLFYLYYAFIGQIQLQLYNVFFYLISILCAFFLATGIGLIISSLTTRFRDIVVVIPFIIQIWMFGSPVVYSSNLVPEEVKKYYFLNPVATLLEVTRGVVLENLNINYFYILYSIMVSFLFFVVGIILFRHAERNFLDTI